MYEHCIDCGLPLMACDADPNGDKNSTCARCRAMDKHDFDRFPDATFARNGERTDEGRFTPYSRG